MDNAHTKVLDGLNGLLKKAPDVDMAEEMVDFVKNQILQQSGTAMLAQANMQPQSILQLFGG